MHATPIRVARASSVSAFDDVSLLLEEELGFQKAILGAGTYQGLNIPRLNLDCQVEADTDLVKNALGKLRAFLQQETVLMRESVVSAEVNGALIEALAVAGAADRKYGKEAQRLAQLAWKTFFDGKNGRLLASFAEGEPSSSEASAKGYATMIGALLELARGEGGKRWLERAVRLQGILDERYGSEQGPYLIGAKGSDGLLPANLYSYLEDEYGSANGRAVANLKRLEQLRPGEGYGAKAAAILKRLPEEISYSPENYAQLVRAAHQ